MTYPDDFINKVICGDCLETMKHIPDGAVDLVVTDPPYMPPAQHYASRDSRWNKCWGDYSPMVIFFDSWLKELKRIIKQDGSVFIFSNDQSYPVVFVSAVNKWNYIRCLKWDKGDNHFTLGTGFVFRPRSELIAHCHNSNPFIVSENRGDIIREPVVKNKDRSHPAEKPIEIIKQLINATSLKTELIIDCFLGSGTTAVACKQLGRRYIGIEISPDYCKIAEDRLRQEELF